MPLTASLICLLESNEPYATFKHKHMASKTKQEDLVKGGDSKTRCSYNIDDPDFRRYHDEEFGRPVDDDRRIFEKSASKGLAQGYRF